MNLDWLPFAAFAVIAIGAVWSLLTPFERVHLSRFLLGIGPVLLVLAATWGAILVMFQ